LENPGRHCFVFLTAPRGFLSSTGSTGRHDSQRTLEGEGRSEAERDQGGDDGEENDD